MAAAATGSWEVVETLLPLTRPVAGVLEWSVIGIMDAASAAARENSLEEADPLQSGTVCSFASVFHDASSC